MRRPQTGKTLALINLFSVRKVSRGNYITGVKSSEGPGETIQASL